MNEYLPNEEIAIPYSRVRQMLLDQRIATVKECIQKIETMDEYIEGDDYWDALSDAKSSLNNLIGD